VVALTGEVLELRHPRVRVLVRVVDDGDGLELLTVQRPKFEPQGAVREATVAIVEERIHRARVDQMPVADVLDHVAVVGVEHDPDVVV
jgi:hypothetical protein